MRTRRLAGFVGLVVAAALVVTPAVAQASTGGAAKHPNPLADPKTNTAPSHAFVDACAPMSTTKKSNERCDAVARKDFDKVRKREGMGPMILPTDFATLSVPEQLLAISDVERVDRGLAPVLGLSKALNKLAMTGAKHDTDPPFPQHASITGGSGNWAAAGNSALLDDFYWMYDDGVGSGNIDCQKASDDGCWGHRHDILVLRDKPLLMGAAVAYKTRYGTSMTEEFTEGDRSDHVNVAPAWATIARHLSVGLAASKATIITHTAALGGKGLVVRAYTTGTLTAKVTSGAAHWSVSPRSCHLTADKTCTLKLRFHAAKRGTYRGKLRVTGANGSRTVTLTGERKS